MNSSFIIASVRVDVRRTGRENYVDPQVLQCREVRLKRAWIRVEILMRRKLHRVNEDRHDNNVSCVARLLNQ